MRCQDAGGEMTERLTGDYSEILATKSQELAELTKALNEGRNGRAKQIAYKLGKDFMQLACIADDRYDISIGKP